MSVITVSRPSHEIAAVVGADRKKLFHLQALRGLAASLVVFSHCANALAKRDLIPQAYAERLGISGYFGVATFFIISGFIIYKTSASTFGDMRGSAAFIARRLIRIIPVYWIATAAFIVLSPHRATITISDIVQSLFLVPHADGSSGVMNPLVGQGWTLQYEMQFYVIFSVGLLLSRRIGPMLIVVTLVAIVAMGDGLMPLSDMADPLTLAQFWTRPIVLLFAVGIGFGMLEQHMPRSFAVPYPFLLMLAVLGAWFVYSLTAPLTAMEQIQFPTVLVVWLLCAVWVFASIFGQRQEGVFEWISERFGDASYSVYLFHTFILSALLRLKVPEFSPLLFIVAALVFSNLFGFMMYRLVESPILGTFRRRLLRTA